MNEISVKAFHERMSNPEYRKYVFKTISSSNIKLKYNLSYPILKGDKMSLTIPKPNKWDTRTTDIHHQVFIKIASEQIKGTPEEIINYAKNLEKVFDNWE